MKKIKLVLAALLIFNIAVFAQNTALTGTVVSATDNMVLPGVTVMVVNTIRGTTTDLDGNFKIDVKNGDQIRFSFIGFVVQTVTYNGQKEINISLVEDVAGLGEVVVVGYGSLKKDNVTGAVSKYKTEALNDLPVSRLDLALQGRIAGVNVQNTSSEAGSDLTIQIRGIASISANAQPLVVVDGQPIQDGLSSLNIADIQDVTVLKDAASAAIYGSRGANGVILVTTKSGGESKAKYSFTYSYGLKSAYEKWDVATITDYIHQGLNEDILRVADGITTSPVNTNRRAAYYIENFLSDGPTDYQDEFLRTGRVQNVQLNASGGTKGFNYYVSGGFNGEEGLTLKSDYNKLNFRVKLDVDLSKRIKLDININPSYAKTQRPFISDLNNFLRGQSWIPTRLNQETVDFILNQPLAATNTYYSNADVYVGAFAHAQFFRNIDVPAYEYFGPLNDGAVTTSAAMTNMSPWTTSASNPLFSVLASDDNQEDYRVQSNLGLSINLAEGLDFRTTLSYYSKFSNRLKFTGSRAGLYGSADVTNANAAAYSKDTYVDLLTENLLTYKKSFNGVHNLDLTALYSAQKTSVSESDISAAYFPNDDIRTLNAGRSDSYFSTGTTNKVGLISYMARVMYSYDNKYDFSASIRTDGSSLFKNDKWAVFPAVSVGWNIAKENFIGSNLSWLSKLKLRGSYGATGNNRVETISGLINSYNPGYNIFDYASYLTGTSSGTVNSGLALPNVFPNEDLTWETTYQTNLGLDLSVLSNRFNLSVDVYNSNTKDLLLLESTRAFSGAPQSWINVGSLNNKGLEIELSTTNISNKKFTWLTVANFSKNVNELKDFGSLTSVININSAALLDLGTSSFSDYYITEVGRPLTQLFGYKTDGVWLSQADIDAAVAGGLKNTVGTLTPGALKIVDLNGDTYINESDRTVIGDPYPDFTWGITNVFKIYEVELSFSLQGVQGIDVYNGETISNEAKQYVNNFTSNHYISPTNPGDGKTPFELNGNIKWQLTDFGVEDGSYWKLNDITIAYTLDKDFVKKLGLSNLRIYFTAQNLYYHFAEGYRGINPEARNTKGTNPLTTGFIQYQSYAIPKTIIAGLEINF